MSKKYFFNYFIFFVISIVLFPACEKTTDIKLNKNEIILAPSDTTTLIAFVEPASAKNNNVKWISSDETVATVSDNGLVTAIANGKATITATAKNGKFTDYCSVIVDFRINYIGDWDFVVKRKEWSFGHISESTDYYLGKIVLDNDEQRIIIKYLENNTLRMYVNEMGSLFDAQGRHAFCGGFYEKDKMYIKGSGSNMNGSQGYELRIDGNKMGQ